MHNKAYIVEKKLQTSINLQFATCELIFIITLRKVIINFQRNQTNSFTVIYVIQLIFFNACTCFQILSSLNK